MFVLRNLVVIFGFLVFATAVNAANEQSASAQTPISAHKVVTSEEGSIKPININSADVKTLQKVKSIGKKKAEAIAKYRSKKGPFNATEDLLKIKCRGINKKWLDKVSKFLTV